MKKKLNIIVMLLLVLFLVQSLAAQQQLEISNQNSNYKLSLEHYRHLRDSFNSLQSTTIDKTYSALDWYEKKLLAKKTRLEYRREKQLNRQTRRYLNNPRYYNNLYPTNPNYGYYNNNNNNWSDIIYPFALYSTLAAINAIL